MADERWEQFLSPDDLFWCKLPLLKNSICLRRSAAVEDNLANWFWGRTLIFSLPKIYRHPSSVSCQRIWIFSQPFFSGFSEKPKPSPWRWLPKKFVFEEDLDLITIDNIVRLKNEILLLIIPSQNCCKFKARDACACAKWLLWVRRFSASCSRVAHIVLLGKRMQEV